MARSVSIVVVGDAGSGKTSLISSACLEQFSEQPVPVLPVARFPAELLNSPDDVGELLVADTSSKLEDARATEAALRAAAAVVVCVDAAAPRALERLRGHWLPEVARLNPAAPVVVAVCKDDREDRVDLAVLREVRCLCGCCLVLSAFGWLCCAVDMCWVGCVVGGICCLWPRWCCGPASRGGGGGASRGHSSPPSRTPLLLDCGSDERRAVLGERGGVWPGSASRAAAATVAASKRQSASRTPLSYT